jgi:hypothetical protein
MKPPHGNLWQGRRNRYGAKERATTRNEREKLWPAWQGMARRTPGASLRVNAPFIPITVLPLCPEIHSPGGGIPARKPRAGGGGDSRPPGISLKGGYPGDWRRYGTAPEKISSEINSIGVWTGGGGVPGCEHSPACRPESGGILLWEGGRKGKLAGGSDAVASLIRQSPKSSHVANNA